MVTSGSSIEYRIERFSGDTPPDGDELSRQMEAYGFDVFEWADGPQTVYGPHQHSEDQSHWIISGELELVVDGVALWCLRKAIAILCRPVPATRHEFSAAAKCGI